LLWKLREARTGLMNVVDTTTDVDGGEVVGSGQK
jgi:hypothetical protein